MIELSKPFEVGKTYTRLDGKQVICIKTVSANKGYETAQFDDRLEVFTARGFIPGIDGDPLDSGFRYNRGQDRGRCTAGQFDDPFNVIPEANPYLGEDHLQWLLKPRKLYKIKD